MESSSTKTTSIVAQAGGVVFLSSGYPLRSYYFLPSCLLHWVVLCFNRYSCCCASAAPAHPCLLVILSPSVEKFHFYEKVFFLFSSGPGVLHKRSV